MNFRTTYILFGVLAGLIVLFGVVLLVTQDQPPDTKLVFPSFQDKANPVSSTDIDTIVVERTKPEAQKITLQRDPETRRWKMTEPLNLGLDRVDASLADRLVNQVMNLRIDDDGGNKGSLKEFDLDDPHTKVTLKKGDRTWQLSLGKELKSGKGNPLTLYVSSSDRKEPMVVKPSGIDLVSKSPHELRAREMLAENTEEIRRVALFDGSHTPVILKRDAFEQWRYEQPAEYGQAEYRGETLPPTATPSKTLTGVKALLDMLTAFKVDVKRDKDNKLEHDFVSDNVKDLERYGLTGDKLLKIQVRRAVGISGKEKEVEQTLVIGKPVDDKGEKVFAMLEGENHVVKVSAANLEQIKNLIANPGIVRNRDLLAVAESNVDAVAVVAPGMEMEFFRTAPGKWKMYRKDRAQGDDADGFAVGDLLKALTNKGQVKEFPDKSKADLKVLQLDPPVATVSLWEQGIKKDGDKPPEGSAPSDKPQLKEAKPTVKLMFGKRENGLVYILREMRDGTTTLVTVPDTLMDSVGKPPLTYLDKSLPPLVGDVTVVTLERGGEKFVVAKDKDKGTWSFKEPKELEGKLASSGVMASIVGSLQFLRPDRIVAEKASAELEEQYGLKAPSTKVILGVTKDDKTEDWTYLFGKEDGDNVYARLSSKDMIFQVKKATLGILQSELRDTTLFAFAPTNVQTMKVQGWAALFPANPQTVELERKSATDWKVKSTTPAAPIANLDFRKAEDLLSYVLRQKVDKFIGKSGPQPQKMLLTDDAISIELTVTGEKDPVVLLIGGETPDQKGWFAKSSTLPGEYFILAKDPTNDLFAKLRSQPPSQYFSAAPK